MIDRSTDRIRRSGEVFTPLPLVDVVLDHLPQEIFADPDANIVDPSSGDGNFLVRVITRKMLNGLTVVEALSTTFGVELLIDNTLECRTRAIGTALEVAHEDDKMHVIRTLVQLHNILDDNFPPNVNHLNSLIDVQYLDSDFTNYLYTEHVALFCIVKYTIVCADALNGWNFDEWEYIP